MTLKRTFILMVLILSSCGLSKKLMSAKELSSLNYQEVEGFYSADDDEFIPDQFPMYPNGLGGLMMDVGNNIMYPDYEHQNNIEGRVILKYTIKEKGIIDDIRIERSATEALDNEAIRVIKTLKRWHPGYVNNKPVKIEFTQPFNFKLE